MSKNTVSQISNAFSTGGGGVNFEQQIQAMFLLSLLVDGFCPVMNEPTKRVCFQKKRRFDLDDIVVFTHRGKAEGKMLCQIKHSITATETDRVFRDVICAAWSDFNKDSFDKDRDILALAVAQIAYKSQQAFRFLHAQAVGAYDAQDFFDRVNAEGFSNSNNQSLLTAIKNIITTAKEDEPTQLEVWRFCKCLVLLLFDMDCVESINRSLSSALIRCKSTQDPFLVWSSLVEYAAECNQTAASIDRKNVKPDILSLFSSTKTITLPPDPIPKMDSFIPTVALIGAWDERNEFDQRVIEAITGITYSEFEAKTRAMLVQDSNYLTIQNGHWTIQHKEDLLNQCKESFFDNTLEKVIEVTETLFSQESRHIQNGEWVQYIAITEYDNSEALRDSILNSVCWIKKSLAELKQCSHDRIEARIDNMVRAVLKEGEKTTWLSLRDDIRYIAELSPEVFITKIEWCVHYKQRDILQLFPKSDSSLFGQTNCIANVLWALEILAWSPVYFVQAICALGQLESIPYEQTNWGNTPINSIVSILLPWYPQTLADIEKRKAALQSLKTDSSSVFWKVLVKLLPNCTSSTTANPRPQLLQLEIPAEITVTNQELQDQYACYLEWAVSVASAEIEKLAELTEQMEYMNEKTLLKYLDSIAANEHLEDRQRLNLWIKLRECIVYSDHDGNTIFNKNLERIQEVISAIEPKEPLLRYQEYYLGSRLLFEGEDPVTRWDKLETKKADAIKELFKVYGIAAIEQFGVDVNNTYDVAAKLGQSIGSDELSTIIDSYETGEISSDFAIACISSFAQAFGAHKLLDTSLSKKNETLILEVVTRIPVNKELLDVISQLCKDDSSYWQKARMPYVLRGQDAELLNPIVCKLKACKRYVSALNLIGLSEFVDRVSAEEIHSLLLLAGTEESIGAEMINNYAAQNIIKWFQNLDSVELESRSDIDFIYFPLLNDYPELYPHALFTRLSTDPVYFCSLLELYYKKSSEEQHEHELNKGLSDRLFTIMFHYKATPGVDWEGNFNETVFREWLAAVKTWSAENDRFSVAMLTVGSGLSYAKLDENGLPDLAIMGELNKVENVDLRRGFYLGILNQRGVYTVDPDGKPERELSEKYTARARLAMEKGYPRFAGVLGNIAEFYSKEAEHNMQIGQEDAN